MEKRFDHTIVEPALIAFWDERGSYVAKVTKEKEPFCIILPPPNANADLHLGHAMFVYEDIMIRYNKLAGKEVLWLPGFDHAGFETQFVFEKHLKKQGKSRFDYDRDALYQLIWDFVEDNKPKMRNQLKRLGFALDWSKEQFTAHPDIVKIVYRTFKKLFEEGRLYRKERLVNYCTVCGTSFSDLEVQYEEKQTKLWYIRYALKDDPKRFITVATTRPETMLGDTAVAVNPKDKRFKDFIGKTVVLPIMNREIPVVADDMVDPKFGTGAVKMTPAHDPNDWQVAQRHNLPSIQVIGFNGRMTDKAGKFAGLKTKIAREEVLKELAELGVLEKEKDYTHRVGVCYKSSTIIEPLPLEQWFIDVKPMAAEAKKRIEADEITFFPKKYKRQAIQILDNYQDWNISRQIVWGIRIPAFRNTKTGEWVVETDSEKQKELLNNGYEQDQDTFDTWFSSGQWPFATLENVGQDFLDYFYPTAVMETGHDILRAWVARMAMLGILMNGDVPFRHVFLHGMVRDKHGQKMSKSKGNVVNPIEFMDKYGTDALRAALIFGTKDGGDTNISEEKVIGMRNFANKVWNIGRFLQMNIEQTPMTDAAKATNATAKELKKEFAALGKKYRKYMSSDKFSKGLEECYQFLWHRFADYYIETLKEGVRNGDGASMRLLHDVYLGIIVMLHPFMPFVTESVWRVFNGEDSSIADVSFGK